MGSYPLSPAWSARGMRWPPKPDEHQPPRLQSVAPLHTLDHRTFNTSLVPAAGYPHFLITMANYPQLLRCPEHYHPPTSIGDRLMPGVLVHFGPTNADEHERLLYSTVKYELQETIREYLHRTQRTPPIQLFFDMSDME